MAPSNRAGQPAESGRHLTWATLAALVGMCLALLVTEMVLRVSDRLELITVWQEARTAQNSSIWIKSPNPRLTYQHRPDYVRDQVRLTERSGILRPDDVPFASPAGALRVLALGDSVGAAIKLPYEERAFTLVERELQARLGRPTQVLNFCVNGYSTQQEAILLAELAGQFEADVLVLQYCVNDFYPTEYPGRWFKDRSVSYLVDLTWRELDRHVLRGYPPAAYWEDLYRTDDAGWQSIAEGFRTIARYASSRNMPALLAIFPAVSINGWQEGDAVRRHAQVATLARKAGFSVLDLLPVYAPYPVDEVRVDPWDTYHLNAAGQEIAAVAITERLETILTPPAGARPSLNE